MANQWLKGQNDIKIGDDTVTIVNFDRSAHTESDMFVYLHKRKMLFGGDVILNKQIPALVSKAANADGYIAAFDFVTKKFTIEKVVPGHGPMGGIEVLKNFKQYFVDMETAAHDDTKKSELVAKYDDWTQLPFLMSPGATISLIKKNEGK